MTVNDVATQLKYGELRAVASKHDLAAIVSYINLALIDLYGKFKISRSEQLIDLIDNTSIYPLNPNVMVVETVFNELGELAVNDDSNINSVFTPSYDTLQVPNAKTGAQVSVLYIASPETLVVDTNDTITNAQIVRIPPQLLEPLLHYVGYRAHMSVNGDIKAENNTHYIRYNASCKRIVAEGLIRIDTVPASVNLQEGIADATD